MGLIRSLAAKDSLRIRSLFDAGCGSMHWMKHLLQSISEDRAAVAATGAAADATALGPLHYFGADIVPELIANHQQQFAAQVSSGLWDFGVADLAVDAMPGAFDLVICRHALFHNTIPAVARILLAFSGSGSRLLLATSQRFDAGKWIGGMTAAFTHARSLRLFCSSKCARLCSPKCV
jgi:SAM-dependent methyltransferase